MHTGSLGTKDCDFIYLSATTGAPPLLTSSLGLLKDLGAYSSLAPLAAMGAARLVEEREGRDREREDVCEGARVSVRV